MPSSQLIVLNAKTSIVNQYLRALRDVNLQQDGLRFERNLERIGMVAGYELSQHLEYVDHDTKTPLGIANTPVLKDKIVLSTILRAGLPLHRGLHKILDTSALAFVAAGRKPGTKNGVEIDLAYIAAPDLTGKVLIIADTMLATGRSIVDTYNAFIKNHGQPKQVFIVSVIASQPGVDYVLEHLPNVRIIVGALDPKLNDDYFIVPGLGDAGDVLYGPKL